jgi:nucleoside-diphosphate-sugar epimerase
VYGARGPEKLTEESSISPVSLYAETKIRSEEILLKGAQDDSIEPVIVRFATIFGLSRRMRFDLVLNILTAKAVWENEIKIYGGDQWRPLIHVKDASGALISCLEASAGLVSGEVFNAGSDRENYRIMDLETMFLKLFPGISVHHFPVLSDERSYNVSFKKVFSTLGFEAIESAESGVMEMVKSFRSGNYTDFLADKYYNVKYRYK